jgi:hypothetical protein
MDKPIIARCARGRIIVTDTEIRFERRWLMGLMPDPNGTAVIPRRQLQRLKVQWQLPALFGIGGRMRLIFSGPGIQRIQADLVHPRLARKIYQELAPQLQRRPNTLEVPARWSR